MAGKVTDFRKAEIWLLGYLVTFASKYKSCERGQMICSNSQDFVWGNPVIESSLLLAAYLPAKKERFIILVGNQ